MLAVLAGEEEFSVEAAIYWFASDCHGGQWSNLYEALCQSPYRTGPLERGCPDDAKECYEALEERFARPTCEIKWIDAFGHPTPDNNPAIQRCRTKDRDQIIAGRKVHFSASPWFCICAEHSKQLGEPGMEIWEVEGL
jgi:hypothetical protein